MLALALASLAHASGGASERALTAPSLQAAHNSGQGWQPRLTRTLIDDGVTDLRDGIYWSRVEQNGAYVFDQPTTSYPDAIARAGAGMTLTVNAGHPEYDDGHTPHSPEAVAAMAAYVAAAVQRFPAIHTVEVGNEVNAGNFVSGPVHAAGIGERARYHLAILRAIHSAVKSVRPEVRVLGGSAHSISGRYLGDVFAQGGASVMDALALHPYTTPVPLMTREIAYLRRLPGAAGIGIEITEFGHDGPDSAAADHLVQSYCAYALADVAKVTWYPLHPRGDGFAPLYTERGLRTEAGEAFYMVRAELSGRPVHDASPDPFTQICAFGPAGAPTHLLVSGAPRGFEIAPGVRVRDATGQPTDTRILSLGAPLVFSSPDGGPVRLGEALRLAPQMRRADSYLQFALPLDAEAQAPGDGFERVLRTGDAERPLVTRPGQDASGVPWRPYRAQPDSTFPRLTEAYLMPSRSRHGPVEVLHRYRAEGAEDLMLDLTLAPWDQSEDGITVVVRAGGAVVFDAVLSEPLHLVEPVSLAPGDAVEIAVGPNDSADGDYVEYRFILTTR